MISRMAIEDIESLEERGIHVSPRDVIRLNAAGLQIESNRFSPEWFCVHRAARVGDVTFRQPTVGHEMWLAKVEALSEDDFETAFALRIYALSHKLDDLCDPLDAAAVRAGVNAAIERVKGHTFEQIDCALRYVERGNCVADGERLPSGKVKEDEEEDKAYSLAINSIEAGYVHNGIVEGLGLSLADMQHLSTSEMYAILQESRRLKHGVSNRAATAAKASYFKVLDEIATGGRND